MAEERIIRPIGVPSGRKDAPSIEPCTRPGASYRLREMQETRPFRLVTICSRARCAVLLALGGLLILPAMAQQPATPDSGSQSSPPATSKQQKQTPAPKSAAQENPFPDDVSKDAAQQQSQPPDASAPDAGQQPSDAAKDNPFPED